MAQSNSIEAPRALHGTVLHGKQDRIPLSKWHDDRPRLLARPLLRHDEFPAGKVMVGRRQQDGDLQWKHMFTVQVLM